MDSSAVIVGASSEIGRAVAERFAARGDRLHLWGRDEQRLQAAADACTNAGAPSVAVTSVDVQDLPALTRAADDVLAQEESLRAVVWAAGVFQWGRFDEVDPAGIQEVLATNLTSAAAAAARFLPALIRSAPASLIFIGSGAGRQAYPDNAAYVAAKHGLRGLAEALHLDVCDEGVTVSTITAGLVDAGAGRLAPAARRTPELLLRPADIARAVDFVVDSPSNVCPTEIVLRPATRHT